MQIINGKSVALPPNDSELIISQLTQTVQNQEYLLTLIQERNAQLEVMQAYLKQLESHINSKDKKLDSRLPPNWKKFEQNLSQRLFLMAATSIVSFGLLGFGLTWRFNSSTHPPHKYQSMQLILPSHLS